ncbi:Hypothetical predicted protein, partial [Pelobates cultripes]
MKQIFKAFWDRPRAHLGFAASCKPTDAKSLQIETLREVNGASHDWARVVRQHIWKPIL